MIRLVAKILNTQLDVAVSPFRTLSLLNVPLLRCFLDNISVYNNDHDRSRIRPGGGRRAGQCRSFN